MANPLAGHTNSYHTYEEARAAQYACVRGEIPAHFPGLAQITTALSLNHTTRPSRWITQSQPSRWSRSSSCSGSTKFLTTRKVLPSRN